MRAQARDLLPETRRLSPLGRVTGQEQRARLLSEGYDLTGPCAAHRASRAQRAWGEARDPSGDHLDPLRADELRHQLSVRLQGRSLHGPPSPGHVLDHSRRVRSPANGRVAPGH